MAEIRENVTSPVGRIVDGDPWNMRGKTKYGTNPPQPDLGKDGQQIMELYFGLAIPKNSPQWPQFWETLSRIAMTGYNNQIPNGFSWKVVDGDAPEHNGKTGFAGHWIVRLSTRLQNTKRVNAQGQDLMDQSQLKTGDYVDVLISVCADGHMTNPSLYMSPEIIRFNSYGDAISSGGASYSEMGAAQAAIGSTAPVGGAGMAGGPGAPAPAPAPQQFQQPGAPAPAPAPQQFQQPGAPAPAPAPAAPQQFQQPGAPAPAPAGNPPAPNYPGQ